MAINKTDGDYVDGKKPQSNDYLTLVPLFGFLNVLIILKPHYNSLHSRCRRIPNDNCTNRLFAGHPRFFNQLSCGLDIISMAGEWLTATANTNMFTYEIAPVFILMENVVLTKMREIIGWKDGDSIFAPGKFTE